MLEVCPKCGNEKIIKDGFIRNKQRYKYQFTTSNLQHGKLWQFYFTSSAQAVLNWIRDHAKVNCEKTEPGRAVVVELYEFWHFIAMDLESL